MAKLKAPAPLVDKGYEQITANYNDGLTVPAGAWAADIQAEVQNIRMRLDGVVPTDGTEGHLLVVGDAPYRVTGRVALLQARFETAVAGGKINVQYWSG